jgi:hypothetical protein
VIEKPILLLPATPYAASRCIDLMNQAFTDIRGTAGGPYLFVSQFTALPPSVRPSAQEHDSYGITDAVLYSRFAHEASHYIQNIGSTYGLWKTLVMRVAGRFALEAFLSLGEL